MHTVPASVAAEAPDDGFLHLENATGLHLVVDREGIDLGVGRVRRGWCDKGPGQSGQDHQKERDHELNEPAGSLPEAPGNGCLQLHWRHSAGCFGHRRGELPTPSSSPINLTVEKRTVDIIDIEALRFGQRLVAMPVRGLSGALSG
jgi:hypothetical protein